MDVVSRVAPVVGSTVRRQGTEKGYASYTSNVAQGLVWASLRPVPSIFDTGISLLLFANPAAGGTQQRAFFLGNEDPVPSNQYNQANIAFNCDTTGTSASGLFAALEYDFGFRGVAQSTAGMVDGKWHVFIATRPPGYGTWTLYRDGLNVTGSTGYANAVDLLDGCRVHCHPSGSVGYMGNSVLAVAFNLELDANQTRKLSNNPWQIFQAPGRRLWIPDPSSSSTVIPVFANHYRNQGIM